MSDDFYDDAARKQYAVLQAARARCVANLEEFRAVGDDMDAQAEIQTLATLDSQMRDLANLHQQYHASRNPAPQRMSEAELLAMSPEKLAQHPEAIEAIFAKSKYYDPKDAQDPEFRRRFAEGMAEVQRRNRIERRG